MKPNNPMNHTMPIGERRRTDIMAYITAYIKERGFAPSLRSIQEHIGYTSPAPVDYQLDVLERQGKIRRLYDEHDRMKGLEVVKP